MDMLRTCQQHGMTGMMLFEQGAFVACADTVSFKALHEAMLHAFCREAAWLMQGGVYKSG